MASESSSAVLELNDADTEDTETLTEETNDGAPLIMEHGYDIAVKVDAPMKQLSTLETFVTYRVRCVCARWSTPPYVRRRYNHFKVLHKRLCTSHPLLAPPPLPPLHSARQQLDRYSPSFVAVRTCALDAFLERVAKHPILTYSEDFRIFLTTPDDELDKIFRSESGALSLWGLGTALYSSGETKSGNGPRVKDPEFTSASDYLQSLEQKLTTLCLLTGKLHKSTVALGNEYNGMKRVCDAWSTQAGGRISAAASGAARGAGAAGSAAGGAGGAGRGEGGAGGAGRGARAPVQVSARAPLLAHYAAAIRQKIAARDQAHAAFVSGGNTSDDLHNRLSQASEALRSDLADWVPKTHSEIKSLLLQLAERQVNLHTQALYGWEHAHRLATEQNIDQIFKTVSKTAVRNLSPFKCRSGNDTERDLDDCSDYSDNFVYGNDDSFSKVDDGDDHGEGNDIGNRVDGDFCSNVDNHSEIEGCSITDSNKDVKVEDGNYHGKIDNDHDEGNERGKRVDSNYHSNCESNHLTNNETIVNAVGNYHGDGNNSYIFDGSNQVDDGNDLVDLRCDKDAVSSNKVDINASNRTDYDNKDEHLDKLPVNKDKIGFSYGNETDSRKVDGNDDVNNVNNRLKLDSISTNDVFNSLVDDLNTDHGKIDTKANNLGINEAENDNFDTKEAKDVKKDDNLTENLVKIDSIGENNEINVLVTSDGASGDTESTKTSNIVEAKSDPLSEFCEVDLS